MASPAYSFVFIRGYHLNGKESQYYKDYFPSFLHQEVVT